ANLYSALDADLEIIPIINKIDMPAANPDAVAQEISQLIGTPVDDILRISAKSGENIEAVLEAVVKRVPAPKGDPDAPLRALIFDSHYDAYKGVVAYVRVIDGRIEGEEPLRLMITGAEFKPIEIGTFSPRLTAGKVLEAGEVGYVATGFKTVAECRVGDTFTYKSRPAAEPLPGYRQVKPMVFAGIYPVEGDDYPELKEALEKLQLNDASLVYEPEISQALNFGFRCGFLGMFHMEIIQERLEREYDLDIIVTAPSVAYEVVLNNGDVVPVDSPAELPNEGETLEVREPWMDIEIFTPTAYYGPVMELVTHRRSIYKGEEHPAAERVQLNFEIPLAEIIVDFFDQLKSVTRGYASLDYHFKEYRADELVKLEIHVNMEPIDAFTTIVHKDDAYRNGQTLITKLKDLIPRQLFVVPIQAVSGGRVISRANVKAMRKDVLAKCYGGDVTRKRKLLEKQKKGKKRMKMVGSVEIPQEAFLAVLRLSDD
ncbi:MAG: translation elongation factor 4, partial [Anaerolineales bacterium]